MLSGKISQEPVVIRKLHKEGLVDRAVFFVCPKVIGKDGLAMTETLPLPVTFSDIKTKRIGEDIMVSGKVYRRTN